jgi:Leucine-rich repeat (LRR) protein
MTQETLFGELRSILQRPASVETWEALCQSLELWPSDELEQVALPYTLGILHRWPGEVARVAPLSWVDTRQPPQTLALANRIGIDGVAWRAGARAALFQTPLLRGMTSIKLARVKLTPRELRMLVSAQPLPALTALDVSFNDLGLSGGRALSAKTQMPSLISLDLSGCEIGFRGLEAMINASVVSNLTSLSLSQCALDNYAILALTYVMSRARLTHLDLSRNNWSDSYGMRFLLDIPHLSSLTSLNLSQCGITDAGINRLIASTRLSGLTKLDLSGNDISAAGYAALAAAPRLHDSIRAQFCNP